LHGLSDTKTANAIDPTTLADRLRGAIQGDVRFDRLSRTIYSTDASIYEIVPLGVVLPRSEDDVVATINVCREAHAALIARGGGTGLTGGAVGEGVQLDLSRYMNRIGRFDPNAQTVEVQPGVVLDELNAYLAPHHLHFAPDVATSSRATIGGMIANNSCGAHSIVFGRTVDHVAELTVALSSGAIARFRSDQGDSGDAQRLEQGLSRIRDEYYAEIQARFPKVMRSNGGYGLDRLGPPGTRAEAGKVLCGSEGTLGVVVGAKLRLTPLPKHKALAVMHFTSLFDSLIAVPAILELKPTAVELIDKLIIHAGLSNPRIRQQCGFIDGEPEALLVVEFFAETPAELQEQVSHLAALSSRLGAYAAPAMTEPIFQSHVWALRTSGLGLLMSKPGDSQPYSFVEDTAVDPARLRDYLERFGAILAAQGVHAGYYAHASVGCIHVKPVLNLKTSQGVEQLRAIAEAVAESALEFGGAVTGEHGDGIVRSCWLEKIYGPRIMQAFREVKQLFDPCGMMNPHKIVDPWPMTDHLRHGPSHRSLPVKTFMDFGEHGGMAGMAGMCSGVGQCRQRLVGTMCPSYMATGDETHTTRARANALRIALSNRGLLQGLDDPALAEVMDLCLSCKACKTECPTGVDMARLKAEYLAQRNLRHGTTPRARLLASLPERLPWAARFPRIINTLAHSMFVRGWTQRRYGLDARIPPPRLAHRTFRAWFRRRKREAAPATHGKVVYFVDTWTNYFAPAVGIAAVQLLEAAGFDVICPDVVCCGRPAISQGMLVHAAELAAENVRRLVQFAVQGITIVGTEPSCILTFGDEYPQLVRTRAARLVAERSRMIESFLAGVLSDRPDALHFRPPTDRVLYHGHCHQKALVGAADAMQLLTAAFGDRATQINSGCCGMAGSFGHEAEHYDVARAIGEQRLFPAVRAAPDAHVAISGFSCRQQIEHHTKASPLHIVELLAETLAR
jgi:FAD/FMN-containing dehydrogenase/Fe-S oxidoreductase